MANKTFFTWSTYCEYAHEPLRLVWLKVNLEYVMMNWQMCLLKKF